MTEIFATIHFSEVLISVISENIEKILKVLENTRAENNAGFEGIRKKRITKKITHRES
jgi:hypothetical protein